MFSQRKFVKEELVWLDNNEPFYKEAYVKHHWVPLTADFNARTKQNFSAITVRNRLQSYRNWSDDKPPLEERKKLKRGPILDITDPVTTIKKQKNLSDDKKIISITEKQSIANGSFHTSDSEEESVRWLFSDISNIKERKPSPFNDKGSSKEFRKSIMDYYSSNEKKEFSLQNCFDLQPRSSRSTKTNLEEVKKEIETKIDKAKIKKEKSKEKVKVPDEWKIKGWRHRVNKRNKHSKTPEFKLFKNGTFQGWKMTSQLSSQIQKKALEEYKRDKIDLEIPEDSPLNSCDCGCSEKKYR